MHVGDGDPEMPMTRRALHNGSPCWARISRRSLALGCALIFGAAGCGSSSPEHEPQDAAAAKGGEGAASEAGETDAASPKLDGAPGGDGSGPLDASGDAGSCTSSQLFCEGACVPNDFVNCGTCKNDCTALHATSMPSCVSDQCAFPGLTCAAGWAHCTDDASAGCETDLTQAANCGACANACVTSPLCLQLQADASYACEKVIAIAETDEASFAVFSNGTIDSWGDSTSNALGTGTAGFESLPAPIPGITTAKAVAGGGVHACALLSDGTVACWGDNGYGQLGTSPDSDDGGGISNSPTPIAVAGLSNVKALAAGQTHTCALLDGGTVECWGSNDYGELGTSLATSCNGGSDSCSPTPTVVPGLSNVTAIAIGGNGGVFADYTCALIAGGTVDCWGYNADGELGNGTEPGTSPFFVATPAPVMGLSGAVAITASAGAACALISGGTVNCWGSNAASQLGNGGDNDSSTPVQVSGLSDAVSLSVGSMSSTICAVRTGGSAVCWGANYNGELGSGSNDPEQASTPVAVAQLTNIVSIAAGANHECALLSTGNVSCWGFGGSDELGNPSAQADSNPTPVPVSW